MSSFYSILFFSDTLHQIGLYFTLNKRLDYDIPYAYHICIVDISLYVYGTFIQIVLRDRAYMCTLCKHTDAEIGALRAYLCLFGTLNMIIN